MPIYQRPLSPYRRVPGVPGTPSVASAHGPAGTCPPQAAPGTCGAPRTAAHPGREGDVGLASSTRYGEYAAVDAAKSRTARTFPPPEFRGALFKNSVTVPAFSDAKLWSSMVGSTPCAIVLEDERELSLLC